ncbi:MAG: helix-turn-helix transcriptional regulator [Candidatus Aminicenantes bacterium]|nr:helix-turn-helix transcriptional regulator [Candidatus Aminicenantes bacterium]
MDNLAAFAGLAAVAGASVWGATRLFLKYPQRMLLFYVNALGFAYAFGVLDVIGRFLSMELLAKHKPSPEIAASVALVFRLLAWPCLVLAVYFFIRMILEIRGRRFPVLLQVLFFLAEAAALAGYFLTADKTRLASPVPGLPLFELILLVFTVVNRGAVFALFLWATLGPAPGNDPDRTRGLRVFTGLYAAAYVVYGVSALFMKSRGFLCYTYPVLEFFMHVPPLLYLWIFLRGYYRRHPLEPVREGALAGFFARHQISMREQEIVRLLLEGKSGRDMAGELFVSVKTVKTHVSNIYRKLGVKSRWQLIATVRNCESDYREY